MQDYYGTKRISAEPGVNPDPGDRSNEEGYRVVYADGYESWSPKDTFEAAYKPTTAMNFSGALSYIRDGGRVARAGWNGKDMFVFLVPGSVFKVDREPLLSIMGLGTEVDYHGHIDMKTVTGQIVPWLASQTDLLADDWFIV